MHSAKYWEQQLLELGTRKPELWEGCRQRLLYARKLVPSHEELSWVYIYVNEIGWLLDNNPDPDNVPQRLERLQVILPEMDTEPTAQVFDHIAKIIEHHPYQVIRSPLIKSRR